MDVSTDRTVLAVSYRVERRVEIDVRPSDEGAPVVLRSGGHVPVAILSQSDFSAPEEIDVGSLTFGKTGTEPSLAFCNDEPDDLNLDGFEDLVCHFFTNEAGFTPGDTEAVLRGSTRSGLPIRGVAAIRVIGG